MIRIAHLSDVHLSAVPVPSFQQLLSKRTIGYVNWRRNRARLLTSGHLDALIADMKARAPDHVVVTGDLTNIALPGEFENARIWLQLLGSGEHVTVVPGNHDAYVPNADRIYCRLWAPFMSDDDAAPASEALFPFLRRRGKIALIGVSTAVPTMPFMASGRVGKTQLSGLRKLLQETGKEGLFRIVLIHHPPKLTDYRHYARRLTDAGRLRAVISVTGAELLLHGHDHVAAMTAIDGASGPVPVIGVPAASSPPAAGPQSGGYALHEIETADDRFTLTVTLRGYDAAGQIVDKARSEYSLARSTGPVRSADR